MARVQISTHVSRLTEGFPAAYRDKTERLLVPALE